ncbi:ABC transporter substrate-binding protein [Chitinophaga agrisoli]|uniref:ABC transporter substrate-binding protein n=1 Tax=Chitinophaga agrisoli TaxID=2607653 RepID=A0A5B2VPK7_9BACT|nr:ABC transporter substrate-binding protein [Chitinophaga agrisoli]KAA2241683.1 ABC transporter substrate-binding protein [Chitinophaga agrisoli]
MKVCSFLPAATEMIHQMGLESDLHGVTFECHSDRPRVVRSHIEGNSYSSIEIERIVAQSKAEGRSLYYIDEPLLQQIAPDIIFTQDVCDVCQIDTAYVQRAIYKLEKEPLLIPLFPKNLDDVFDNALTIATAMGKEENAYRLLASLKERTDHILDILRLNKAPLRRVMLMEWMQPVYNCGHWIPYQIAQAGGVDMLSNPSGYSIKIEWDKILQYNPEVLVVAPCGLEITRAEKEVATLEQMPGWQELQAVKNNEVYFADSNLFTCPSTRLVDGIELLAALFHPALFPDLAKAHARSFRKFKQPVIV